MFRVRAMFIRRAIDDQGRQPAVMVESVKGDERENG
jgi:hypothetical protein